MNPLDSQNLTKNAPRRAVAEELRRLLPRLESIAAESRVLTFGLPALDSRLPQGGLAFGALHEVVPQSAADLPAAFGFIAATLARLPSRETLLFVISARKREAQPHGHGLLRLGLDPSRVILVETGHEKQSLWAMEEALRSGVPSAVVGVVEKDLDLKTSQRLHLAAGSTGRMLLLLRPADAAGTSVAVTRWRIRAAKAARDRFGLIERLRWHAALERCRNGRPGEWLVEFDHAAHCFSLAAPLADPALPQRASTQNLQRAG